MPAPKPGIVRGVACPRCNTDEWYKTKRRNSKGQTAYQCKQCRRNRHLRSKYGISQQEYNTQLKKQDGRCAICQRKRKLFVDHHHKTHALRQLLCANCNSGLGLFHEEPTTLRRAAAYIERHEE